MGSPLRGTKQPTLPLSSQAAHMVLLTTLDVTSHKALSARNQRVPSAHACGPAELAEIAPAGRPFEPRGWALSRTCALRFLLKLRLLLLLLLDTLEPFNLFGSLYPISCHPEHRGTILGKGQQFSEGK